MESVPPLPPPANPAPSLPPPIRPRGWWSRNWLWVLPTGCLSLALLGCVIVFLVVAIFFSAMKSSDVYKEALRRAQNDPNVTAALGKPVTDGMFMTGSTNVEGANGAANLSVPIHGPNGKGTLYVTAAKSQGKWVYQTLAVEIAGTGKRIPLAGDTSGVDASTGTDDDEDDAEDSDAADDDSI